MTDTTSSKTAAVEQISNEKTVQRSSKRRMAREPMSGGSALDEGVEPAGQRAKVSASKEPRGPSKIASVIALIERSEGATLAEMVAATGWLPHTTRAALTGLKKKGHVISKDKRDDVTCYRVEKSGE